MPIVADTGPILAAANRNDQFHGLAAQLIDKAGRDLIVPDPVVSEVDWILRSRSGTHTAQSFLQRLVEGTYQRAILSPSVFAAAVELDRRYANLDLGLADVSVMAVAELTRAPILTFDFMHFRATRPTRGRTWDLVIEEVQLQAWRGLR